MLPKFKGKLRIGTVENNREHLGVFLDWPIVPGYVQSQLLARLVDGPQGPYIWFFYPPGVLQTSPSNKREAENILINALAHHIWKTQPLQIVRKVTMKIV